MLSRKERNVITAMALAWEGFWMWNGYTSSKGWADSTRFEPSMTDNVASLAMIVVRDDQPMSLTKVVDGAMVLTVAGAFGTGMHGYETGRALYYVTHPDTFLDKARVALRR